MELTDPALAALLDWHIAMGVDIALDDAPHDRYAESAATPRPSPAAGGPRPGPAETERAQPPHENLASRAAPPRVGPPVPLFPQDAVAAAREAAAAASDLDALRAALETFEHAPFRDGARHFLFGAGRDDAPLMIFDTAPGEDEERSGEPFCGETARLLANILSAVGIRSDDAALAYFSAWRPAKPMTQPEAAIFAPFARKRIELARPRVVLAFGEAPARALLGTTETLTQMRSKWIDASFGAATASVRVFPSLEVTLKTPTFKASIWKALRDLRQRLA